MVSVAAVVGNSEVIMSHQPYCLTKKGECSHSNDQQKQMLFVKKIMNDIKNVQRNRTELRRHVLLKASIIKVQRLNKNSKKTKRRLKRCKAGIVPRKLTKVYWPRNF